MRAVAVTVKAEEGASAIPIVVRAFCPLRLAFGSLNIRIDENTDNIDIIADALRAAGNELESICWTGTKIE